MGIGRFISGCFDRGAVDGGEELQDVLAAGAWRVCLVIGDKDGGLGNGCAEGNAFGKVGLVAGEPCGYAGLVLGELLGCESGDDRGMVMLLMPQFKNALLWIQLTVSGITNADNLLGADTSIVIF